MTPQEETTSQRPIIKKVKKGKHGHHGGSWKVAYADFVTAMMAFFLLLWLLGSVDQDKRKQIEAYFERPVSALFSSGSNTIGDELLVNSQSMTGSGIHLVPDSVAMRADRLRLIGLKEQLEREILSNPLLKAFKDQLRFEMTDRGLVVQMMDKDQRSMFSVGSAALEPYASDLLREIARLLNSVPNHLIVSGHTDATPYIGGEAGYSNWELSADRANSARRALVSGGIMEGKILRVEGLASTDPLRSDEPRHPANRRITILLLNQETERSMRENSALTSLVPEADSTTAVSSASHKSS